MGDKDQVAARRGVNLAGALTLGRDLWAGVTAAQGRAGAAGLPMRAVYGLATAALLLPPTLMMGATVPLAGAACQRQLGAKGDALIPVLLFVNTVWAAVGAWSASALLLPWWGQRAALAGAIGCNGFAGSPLSLITISKPTNTY